MTEGGTIAKISALSQLISGSTAGSSCFRNEIFGYIHPGEELVRQPFKKKAVPAYKCTGFWQCMDTFKDKQRLEDLNQGVAPWKVGHPTSSAPVDELRSLPARV